MNKKTRSNPLALELNISPVKIGAILIVVTLILMVLHLASHNIVFFHNTDNLTSVLMSKLDMGYEMSIPTWYAQMLLFAVGVLLAYIARAKFAHRDRDRYHWFFLSALFVYLSIDEGSGLHEILGILDIATQFGIESTYLGFAWVFPAAFLVLGLGMLFMRFWLRLPGRTRVFIAISIITFLSGALGVEMLSADYRLHQVGSDDFTYRGILALIEEGLEKFGIIVLICTLLDYIKTQKMSLSITAAK